MEEEKTLNFRLNAHFHQRKKFAIFINKLIINLQFHNHTVFANKKHAGLTEGILNWCSKVLRKGYFSKKIRIDL